MVNFYLPDFYYFYKQNIKLIELLRDNPEWFYDDVRVGAVYGSFPNAVWNGGRVVLGNYANLDNIECTIRDFNDLGVPVRFTWTNPVITEEYAFDRYCNVIMEKANNGMNQVIVNAEWLECYLREKYPNFGYISSTTKCLTDKVAVFEELKKDYELVVLDYNLNKDIGYLESIESRDRLELLVDAWCVANCPRRADHYKQIGLQQSYQSCNPISCPFERIDFYQALENKNSISVEDLYDVYHKELGIEHFKLEGRNMDAIDVIESYVYYMVKPEWKDNVRLQLLKAM